MSKQENFQQFLDWYNDPEFEDTAITKSDVKDFVEYMQILEKSRNIRDFYYSDLIDMISLQYKNSYVKQEAIQLIKDINQKSVFSDDLVQMCQMCASESHSIIDEKCHECCNHLNTTRKIERPVISHEAQKNIVDILKFLHHRSTLSGKKELYKILLEIQELYPEEFDILHPDYTDGMKPRKVMDTENCTALHIVDSVKDYEITKWYNNPKQLIGFAMFLVGLQMLVYWIYHTMF